MKILLITNKVPYPPKDGGAIATLNMASGLANAGNEVTILAMNTSKHFFDLKNLPADLSSKINFIDVYVRTTINPLTAILNLVFSGLPYNAVRFINRNFDVRLTELLKTHTFDVIQLEGLYLGFYLKTIRKHSKAHVSYRAHNIEHEIWERTVANQENFLKKKYLKILAKRIKKLELGFLNKYDSLVAITKRDCDILNKLGNNKPFCVTPTGIDTSNMTVANQSIEFPSLFHIGALDWPPNQEGLIWFISNCWGKIHDNHPDLKFYIAGRNAPESFVNKIKESNIEYLGEVDSATDFMNSKAIMVVPLLSGSGMRIKIIEGMALGKTIITTSIGSEGIETTNNLNILIANSPEEFVSQIKICLANVTFFKEIGKNAATFVSQFYDNNKIAKTLTDFFKTAV